MKSTFLCTCIALALTLDAAGQVRVGLQHTGVGHGMSPELVTGLAALNTVLPVVAGAMMLHAEENEALGGALLVWGWVVGPAPFSFYYRDTTPAFLGLGVRSGTLLLAAAAVSGGSWDEDGSAGTEIALIGLVLVSGVTTVLNIVGLPDAVRRYHESERLSIAPWMSQEGGGMSVVVRL